MVSARSSILLINEVKEKIELVDCLTTENKCFHQKQLETQIVSNDSLKEEIGIFKEELTNMEIFIEKLRYKNNILEDGKNKLVVSSNNFEYDVST